MTCGLNPLRDRATWRRLCAKKQCDVLGCVQPKDDRYVASFGPGAFTWCTTHGQLNDRIEQLRKRAGHALTVAAARGLVA